MEKTTIEPATSPLEELDWTGPTHAKVTQYVREQILSGKWAPKSRLPSIKALAKMLGTNYGTTYTGLTPLVKEGLLMRVDGSGTYIGEFAPPTQEAKATRACIYYAHDPMEQSDALLQQAVRHHLHHELADEGIDIELMIDSRPESQQGTLFPALQQALKKRDISWIICPSVTLAAFRALQEVQVPTTGLFSMPHRNWVTIHNNLFDIAVTDLTKLGCKSVAVLSHIFNGTADISYGVERNRSTEGLLEQSFYVRFWKAVEDKGLDRAKCSIISPPEPISLNLARFGYKRFKQLWSSSERPDGIIIFSDAVAHGAVTAMLELGVQIPRDLKVFVHRTAEVDFICPLEVTCLELSAKSLVEAFLNQIHRQVEGEPTPVLFSPLVSHKR